MGGEIVFKIGKLDNTSNENVKITSSKLEVSKYGVGVIGYRLGLKFDITGEYDNNKYSFGFDLSCYPEDLLTLNISETIDFNDYKNANNKFNIGETFFNFNNENGVEPDELSIKISKYINNSYLVYITFLVEDYISVIEFGFNLDDYLKDLRGNMNK